MSLSYPGVFDQQVLQRPSWWVFIMESVILTLTEHVKMSYETNVLLGHSVK